MAWTHFKLIEFGQRSIPKVNGVLATINTWYNQSDVLTFEKVNPLDLGVPFDTYKYKVMDGVIESNVAIIKIDAPPSYVKPVSSSNLTTTILQNETYNLINYIPYSSSVDRIKIVEFLPNGSVLNGVGNLIPNAIIMQYDFDQLFLKSFSGTGAPYQNIKYQVGNKFGFNPTIYEAVFNIDGLAYFLGISEEDGTEINMPDSPDIRFFEGNFKLINGPVRKSFKIQFVINLSASAFPVDTENTIFLTYGTDDVEFNSNTIIDIVNEFDSNGECLFNLSAEFNTADLPITGMIGFYLTEVDNDNILIGVPALQEYSINF